MKDADDILREAGHEALRALIEQAVPATLSGDGWVLKLARLTDIAFDRKRKTFAAELGVRLSTLDSMRKAGLAAASGGDSEEGG